MIYVRITCLKIYGFENPNQSEEVKNKAKNTKIKNGNQVPDIDLTNFELYKKRISSLIYKHKKELFNIWDGYDYYDKEYIKDNLILFKYHNKNYPTIDHKISVFYGFKNNIDFEIIGNISNLCITKRGINSTKKSKTEGEFVNKFK